MKRGGRNRFERRRTLIKALGTLHFVQAEEATTVCCFTKRAAGNHEHDGVTFAVVIARWSRWVWFETNKCSPYWILDSIRLSLIKYLSLAWRVEWKSKIHEQQTIIRCQRRLAFSLKPQHLSGEKYFRLSATIQPEERARQTDTNGVNNEMLSHCRVDEWKSKHECSSTRWCHNYLVYIDIWGKKNKWLQKE